MDAEAGSARARLEAWREQGADRLDPLRFGFMDALESRLHGHAGEARRLLEERLSALMRAHAMEVAAARHGTGAGAARVQAATAGPLGGLVAGLAQRRSMGADAQGPLAAGGAEDAAAGADAAQDSGTSDGGAPAAPAMLEGFRRLWDEVRSGSRLRRSLAPAPVDAGPLNSTALAHRAIAQMQRLSPGYARHFLAYVETLGWLERMPGAAAANAASAAGRKSARTRRAS